MAGKLDNHAGKRNKFALAPGYILVGLWVLFTFLLLSWVVLASFSTSQEIFSDHMFKFESGFHFENYAKAWKFQQFNKQSVLGEVGEFQSDCSNAKTLDELKQSYKQFGAEYTEFYDNDGNKAVDAYEMFYQELQDHYSTKGLSSAEAKAKALEVIQEYSQKGYSIANLPDDVDTDEMELFTLVLSKIGVLDANKDGVLTQDEAASYLLTMAQMNDKKNNITSQEYLVTEMAILDPESEEMITGKLETAKKFIYGD